MLATKLLELNASAVCDLYEMQAKDRHVWVKTFLDALIDAPKRLWHPVIVIVDEAHIFCPEKGFGESVASDAMISLTTRGRKRGFCAVLATQRLAKLSKDAAAELMNVLIGQTFIDVDIKRALLAMGISKDDKTGFIKDLKTMDPGHFFAFGRAITKERLLVSIEKVKTTHPEPGSYKHAAAPPPAPAKIKAMLPKLADLPKEAEAKAKTEKELREEIRSLRGMLNARPVQAKEVQVTVTDTKAIERAVKQVQTQAGKQLAECDRVIGKLMERIRQAAIFLTSNLPKTALKFEVDLPKLPAVEIQKKETPRVPFREREHSLNIERVSHPRLEPSNGDVKLASGARRLLAALVSWAPNGMKEGQWRAHAGLKKSGTADTYKSALRSAGFIEQREGLFFATTAGIDYIGDEAKDAPTTTQEVLAVWEPKLASGARKILRALVEAGGEGVSQEEITEKTGLQKSGTFDTYISALRTAQLAKKENRLFFANKETLFL